LIGLKREVSKIFTRTINLKMVLIGSMIATGSKSLFIKTVGRVMMVKAMSAQFGTDSCSSNAWT